jgi:hypothetical protein
MAQRRNPARFVDRTQSVCISADYANVDKEYGFPFKVEQDFFSAI